MPETTGASAISQPAWSPFSAASAAAPTPNSFGSSFLTMQAIGAAGSTVGSYFASQGQKAALASQASIDNTNAGLSEFAAQSALLTGQKQQQSILLKGAQIKSSQKASMAANGIDISGLQTGDTALNLENTTDFVSQSDANTAAANAVRTAFGYRQTATNQTNAALMARATSKSTDSFSAATSTLLTSAKDLGTSAYILNKNGAINKNSFWNMGF